MIYITKCQCEYRKGQSLKKDAYISYQSRLEAIIDGTNAATWEWNVQSGEIIINERWAEIVGYKVEELEPLSFQTWVDLVHPDDLEQTNAIFDKHFDGQLERYECLVRLRHKLGHWVIVQDSGKIVTRTADGKPEWLAGTHIDVTERYKAELILNKLSKTIPGVIFCLNIDNDHHLTCPFISEQASNFFNVPLADIQQTPSLALDIVHKEDLRRLLVSFNHSLIDMLPWLVDFRVHYQGVCKWLQIHAIPEKSEDSVSWYGIVNDIDKQKLLEAKLKQQAELDELTLLPNRRVLLGRLSQLIKQFHRHPSDIAVVIIDLDKFKDVNDNHGHLTGDKLLVQFAHELKNRLRESDVYGRFGGEEFLVIMPNTTVKQGKSVIELLLQNWCKRDFYSDAGKLIHCSFSAGITQLRPFDKESMTVIARADEAMYKAKATGRSRVLAITIDSRVV